MYLERDFAGVIPPRLELGLDFPVREGPHLIDDGLCTQPNPVHVCDVEQVDTKQVLSACRRVGAPPEPSCDHKVIIMDWICHNAHMLLAIYFGWGVRPPNDGLLYLQEEPLSRGHADMARADLGDRLTPCSRANWSTKGTKNPARTRTNERVVQVRRREPVNRRMLRWGVVAAAPFCSVLMSLWKAVQV